LFAKSLETKKQATAKTKILAAENPFEAAGFALRFLAIGTQQFNKSQSADQNPDAHHDIIGRST
jgi:hypothetical protein